MKICFDALARVMAAQPMCMDITETSCQQECIAKGLPHLMVGRSCENMGIQQRAGVRHPQGTLPEMWFVFWVHFPIGQLSISRINKRQCVHMVDDMRPHGNNLRVPHKPNAEWEKTRNSIYFMALLKAGCWQPRSWLAMAEEWARGQRTEAPAVLWALPVSWSMFSNVHLFSFENLLSCRLAVYTLSVWILYLVKIYFFQAVNGCEE